METQAVARVEALEALVANLDGETRSAVLTAVANMVEEMFNDLLQELFDASRAPSAASVPVVQQIPVVVNRLRELAGRAARP